MTEKPTAAFVLSLIGAILILVNGLWVAVVFSTIGGIAFMLPGFESLGGLFLIIAVVAIILGILTLIGAVMMNTTNKDKVRTRIDPCTDLLNNKSNWRRWLLYRLHSVLSRQYTRAYMETHKRNPAPTASFLKRRLFYSLLILLR
jgi:hypothetical protein